MNNFMYRYLLSFNGVINFYHLRHNTKIKVHNQSPIITNPLTFSLMLINISNIKCNHVYLQSISCTTKRTVKAIATILFTILILVTD